MTKAEGARLIAQVATVAGAANTLLASLMELIGEDGVLEPTAAPPPPAKHEPKKPNTEREAMNIDDAAAFTGYSKPHLYRLVHTGDLPRRSGKKNGRLFFKRTELEEYMLRKQTHSNAQISAVADEILNRNTSAARRTGGSYANV